MISHDESYTETRTISDMIVQLDIRAAQQVINPKYLIRAHQTKDRTDTTKKNNNVAIFGKLDLRKYYVEIDGQRYPRDGVLVNSTEK